MEDLKIPVQIRLTVTLAGEDADSLLEQTRFRMTINGCRCRLGLDVPRTPTVSLVELSRSLAKEACQNRDLFLTVRLCEIVRRAWTSGTAESDFAEASADDFREMLLQRVQRGSGINRAVASLEPTGIRLHLSKAQHDRLVESATSARSTPDEGPLQQALETWDAGVFRELGIVLPPATVRCDVNLSEPDFRIQLNDVRLPPVAGLDQRQLAVDCSPEDLQQRVIDFMVLNLDREVRRNAGHFLTAEVVTCSIDLLRDRFPVLVDAVLDRFDIPQLTAVLRDLLHEEVSIRDLRSILESLLSIEGMGVAGAPSDVAWCSSWVRPELRRQLAHRFSQGGGTLAVHLLNAELEARVVQSDRRLLTPEEQRKLLTAVSKAVGDSSRGGLPAVILTRTEARRKFRQLVAKEFPSLGVLSYEELSPDMNIQPLGHVAW